MFFLFLQRATASPTLMSEIHEVCLKTAQLSSAVGMRSPIGAGLHEWQDCETEWQEKRTTTRQTQLL